MAAAKVDIDVVNRRGQGDPERRSIRTGLMNVRCLDAGVLVAKLAFDPEHAEVVAADEVGVVAQS